MSPFATRLTIAAVLACAAIILAIVFRKKLHADGGDHVAALVVALAIVGVPALARALETLF